jgi:hypothetical protein
MAVECEEHWRSFSIVVRLSPYRKEMRVMTHFTIVRRVGELLARAFDVVIERYEGSAWTEKLFLS